MQEALSLDEFVKEARPSIGDGLYGGIPGFRFQSPGSLLLVRGRFTKKTAH